jgi:hypothetical protein
MTVAAFLHFLFWASHYLWLAYAPDQSGLGNHVVYGGNVLDCIAVGSHQLPLHTAYGIGHTANCIMAP